jgi:hypothetical protein
VLELKDVDQPVPGDVLLDRSEQMMGRSPLNSRGSGGARSLDSETRKLRPADTERQLLREELVSLSDFRSGTHAEFGPVGATPCHSMLLAGRAILEPDLHEWLFLPVTA